MKLHLIKFTIFSLLILLMSCCQDKPTPISEAEKTIAKQLIQNVFDDIWFSLDSTKLLDYHTEDFAILENGEVWTNEEIMGYIRSQVKNNQDVVRVNSMDFLDMDKHGDVINMSYHNYASFMLNDSLVGKGQWLESATAIQTPEGWKLKFMHSTWVPEGKRGSE